VGPEDIVHREGEKGGYYCSANETKRNGIHEQKERKGNLRGNGVGSKAR